MLLVWALMLWKHYLTQQLATEHKLFNGLQHGNPFDSKQPVRFVNSLPVFDQSRKRWFNLIMESSALRIEDLEALTGKQRKTFCG